MQRHPVDMELTALGVEKGWEICMKLIDIWLTNKEAKTNKPTKNQTNKQSKQTNKQTKTKQKTRSGEGVSYLDEIDKQSRKQTNKQTKKQTNKQTDQQANKN